MHEVCECVEMDTRSARRSTEYVGRGDVNGLQRARLGIDDALIGK